MISGILLFPPLWLLNTAALHNYAKTPTTGIYSQGTDKLPLPPQKRPSGAINASSNDLKRYALEVIAKYGLDLKKAKEMEATITCESNWNSLAFNKGGNSYGVCQFQPATFRRYCMGDYKNPYDQVQCMAAMFLFGYEDQWDCWCMKYGKDVKSCDRVKKQ